MDGLELLRKIRDGEIKPGARIFDSDGNEYRYDEDEGGYPMVKQKDSITGDEYEPSLSMFTDAHTEFTIVEEIEIDIDSINKINAEIVNGEWNRNECEIFKETRRKINELIDAVKYLYNKGE